MAYGVQPAGYRLPEATHLGRVTLQVADLSRSIAYYESVLGLRVITRDDAKAKLGAHGDSRVLVELHEKKGVSAAPRRGRIGLYHFALLLPDRASLGRFVRHLSSIGAYAGMSDHFVSEAVYLTDPDGLGIEVYADRPRDAWKVQDGELAMTTVPLNVPDLLASAGTQPWAGAPAGTVLGHVHLYVRDLEDAERFYHAGLGFDKVVWSYPGALFMSAGGYHHHLGTNTWAAGAPQSTADDARLLEWEIVVPTPDDVTAAADAIQRAGFPTERVGSAATVQDPWGTQLRLVSA